MESLEPRAKRSEEFTVSFDVFGDTVKEMATKARYELHKLYAEPGAWQIKIDAEPMLRNAAAERVGPWTGRVSASLKL